MKLLFQCLIVIMVLSSNRCKNPPFVDVFHVITIHNKSNESINFHDLSLRGVLHYPDTTLPVSKPILVKVNATSSFDILSKEEWSEILKKLPADTLSIFIFDALVYEGTKWEEIRNDYKILKRYDLSIEDLERLNYTVTYPPTEEMKGIKMYPE